jgi:hypothetical protein
VLVLPGDRGRGAVDKLMKAMGEVAAAGVGGEATGVGGAESGRHRSFAVSYPARREPTALIATSVLLEMGVRGGSHPHESVVIGSLLGDTLDTPGTDLAEYEDLAPFELRVLHPARTLLEKLVHIHELALQLADDEDLPARLVAVATSTTCTNSSVTNACSPSAGPRADARSRRQHRRDHTTVLRRGRRSLDSPRGRVRHQPCVRSSHARLASAAGRVRADDARVVLRQRSASKLGQHLPPHRRPRGVALTSRSNRCSDHPWDTSLVGCAGWFDRTSPARPESAMPDPRSRGSIIFDRDPNGPTGPTWSPATARRQVLRSALTLATRPSRETQPPMAPVVLTRRRPR